MDKSGKCLGKHKMRRFVCVALIVFGFTRSAELNHLVGPTHPLFVVAGDDAILPCYIKPNTSAVDMRVEWFKLDQQDSVVHLYEARENQTTEQSQSYRGRTSLFQPELQKGNASLRLSTVQVTDNGTYKCFIQSESWYDDITVDIIVEAVGTHPMIIVEEFDHSGGLHLLCKSKGWNPEPELVWLDSKGDRWINDDVEKHTDSRGFSLQQRITVYYSDNKYHCRVKLNHHLMETEIIVSDQMFNVWRTSVILISIMVVFSVLAAIVVATFVYRRRGHCNQKIHGEITRIQKYAVDVTLDPDTAHRCLILSEDGRHVRSGEKRQNVPDNPERFDKCGNVLGKEGFSYRRFYFEVIVKGKTEWDLGVAKESITRKEKVALSPQNGYWTVCLRNGDNYSACAGPNVSLSLRVKPQKVGVFVDYEEGLVSFYDVESRSHIYSFTGQSFTEKLYPFLNPCTNVKYRYSAPLRISSVDCQSKLLP
ncbi:butyrophilin subfamily 1 member A1-like isoform X2 [Triplophysa dalaica]|uniref:butyrophilin subfamily 1 member A1-like isoform X2 n=1 Tax=Triplophysa dalaica TaxID=1582913 RepID=UPI0024DFB6EE|nr:butyrophilin subfamily 1 member A1-like isoform X2 [Triplophysa dalaica]